MADKPEFVDMISEATKQSRRSNQSRMVDLPPAAGTRETSRLSHRSERLEQWRLENITPWKIKSWKFKDWGWGS
ncbi:MULTISPECIES: hypothetical protein [Bradyrhizobium]|jgi:hypothetical protein|uniref:Uncharacterized protein n=2 Tax=Bradyrhizobium TaxID=374 RepID=A0ABY0PNK8_9BRAD|nr:MULTISPECIES: hypothetical protein [Bradyrhizobium]SDI69810.1 hypothetical protein SAMN05444163_3487 [Bradyrhizobium ottawaense]SED28152.1 hypothetical protein SAMN05444171_3677 [Bradyrhizobium lablabi]SHL31689.1 hypothetical protein SAMN05444321_2517 [Bradyrhizobium lablabi]